MSLDRRNREREMVSQMIAILCESNFLRSEDIADGFIGLFEQVRKINQLHKVTCRIVPVHTL